MNRRSLSIIYKLSMNTSRKTMDFLKWHFLPLLGYRCLIKDGFGLKAEASKDVASSSPKLLSLIIFIQGEFAQELPSWNISLEELRTSELDMLQKIAFFSVLELHFVLWARFPSSTTFLWSILSRCCPDAPCGGFTEAAHKLGPPSEFSPIRKKKKRTASGTSSIHSTERDRVYFKFSLKNGFMKQRGAVWRQQSVVIHVRWALQWTYLSFQKKQ